MTLCVSYPSFALSRPSLQTLYRVIIQTAHQRTSQKAVSQEYLHSVEKHQPRPNSDPPLFTAQDDASMTQDSQVVPVSLSRGGGKASSRSSRGHTKTHFLKRLETLHKKRLHARGLTTQFFSQRKGVGSPQLSQGKRLKGFVEGDTAKSFIEPQLLGDSETLAFPPDSLPLELSVNSKTVFQGSTLSIRMHLKTPGTLSLKFGQRSVSVHALKTNVYQGFIGIDLETPAGQHNLYVNLHTKQKDFAWYTPIHIQAHRLANTHSTTTIHLSKAQLHQFDKSAQLQEKRLFDSVYGRFTPHKYWNEAFLVPLQAPDASSYGEPRVYIFENQQLKSNHKGVDIFAAYGTLIRASNSGKVVIAGHYATRGKAVVLDHGHGIYSGYFHLSDIHVSLGQYVKRGGVLGKLGNSGLAHKPFLHWEIRVNTVNVNPLEWCQNAESQHVALPLHTLDTFATTKQEQPQPPAPLDDLMPLDLF